MNRKIRKAIHRLYYLPKGFNFFRYSYNKLVHFYKKYTKSSAVANPSAIMIELTNNCNLSCITCPREYDYGRNMDKGNMDFSLFTKIVDQAYPYVDSIGLTGLGEPLLYKNLGDALLYIKNKNKGIITFISTNATLPNTEKLIEKIIPSIDTIQISFDGIGETYNLIRKNGNFNIFVDNLKKIIDLSKGSKIDVVLNCVVVKENYHQLSEMIDFAEQLGVKSLNFSIFNLVSDTNLDVSYYDFYNSREFITEINKAEKKAKSLINTSVTFWDYKSKSGFKKCDFPWSHYSITWDGYLVPCCAKPFPKEKNFGNVNNSKLIDCLNNNEFLQFRKLWYNNSTPAFCKKCHYIDFKTNVQNQ